MHAATMPQFKIITQLNDSLIINWNILGLEILQTYWICPGLQYRIHHPSVSNEDGVVLSLQSKLLLLFKKISMTLTITIPNT